MYKGLHDLNAPAVNDMFEIQTGKQGLRSSDMLNIKQPFVGTVLGRGSLLCRANCYWTQLPNEIREQPDLNMLKRSVSNHIGNEL